MRHPGARPNFPSPPEAARGDVSVVGGRPAHNGGGLWTKLPKPVVNLPFRQDGHAGGCAPSAEPRLRPTFWLAPSLHTLALAHRPVDWGRQFTLPESSTSAPPVSLGRRRLAPQSAVLDDNVSNLVSQSAALDDNVSNWEHTQYYVLQHALIHQLSRHQSCSNDSESASVCFIASPPFGKCHDWRAICPGRRVYAVDVADVELKNAKGSSGELCATLWSCNASREYPDVVRVTGNPPLLRRHPNRQACALKTEHLRKTLSLPYMSHSRGGKCHGGSAEERRPFLVALAASPFGHFQGDYYYRARELRSSLAFGCLQRMALCTIVTPNQMGTNMERVYLAYRRSVFCLQPPGDSIARAAIVDALAAGCIPVLLHPRQPSLWPWHWSADEVSVLFDWTDRRGVRLYPSPSRRSRLSFSGPNASALFAQLEAIPPAVIQEKQRAIARVVDGMTYRGETVGQSACRRPESRDAFDLFLRGALEGRPVHR